MKVVDDFLEFKDLSKLFDNLRPDDINNTGSYLQSKNLYQQMELLPLFICAIVPDNMYEGYIPKLNKKTNSTMTNIQLSHNIYKNDYPQSNYYIIVNEIFRPLLNVHSWLRIKINLIPCTENIIEHGYHVDGSPLHPNQKTAIYYYNTNDGYTLFKDNNKKIKSVENRLIEFSGNKFHTGTTCTDQPFRVVLNMNYV